MGIRTFTRHMMMDDYSCWQRCCGLGVQDSSMDKHWRAWNAPAAFEVQAYMHLKYLPRQKWVIFEYA